MRRVMLLVALVAMLPLHVMGGRAQLVPSSVFFSFEGPWNITSDSDGDTPAAVDLLGGSGGNQFKTYPGLGECSYESDGDGTPASARAGTCSARMNGTYSNMFCGDGTVWGTGDMYTRVGAVGADEVGDFTYSIVFTNFIGVVTGTFREFGTTQQDILIGTVILTAPEEPQVLDTGDCETEFNAIWGLEALNRVV